MNLLILLLLAVLPVILICTYIYKKDKNKEPIILLIALFLSGIAACFLVLGVSDILFKIIPVLGKKTNKMNFFEIMFYSFVGVGLVEELCKWIMVYILGYKNKKEYDEAYDIYVYATFVALGFAFFENLLYVLGEGTIIIGLVRGILSVPGHACDGICMGYFLSLAKQAEKKEQKNQKIKYLLLSILAPAILHGIFDFCLFGANETLTSLFFVFVINLFIFSYKTIKKESINNKSINLKNKFCPNCGNQVTGQFCGKCGMRQE